MPIQNEGLDVRPTCVDPVTGGLTTQCPPSPLTPSGTGQSGGARVESPCFPGLSRSPDCQPTCSGLMSNRYNICATTFCQLPDSPVEGPGVLLPCQRPIGYQPQYPPVSGPGSGQPGETPVNPQSPPGGSSCPPGEVLECVDAFPSLDLELSPASLPLVEDYQPFAPGPASQALPQLISVAVQGWDSLVSSIQAGFAQLTQSLSANLVQATLPAEGGLLRSIDTLNSSLAKIDTKLLNHANELLGEGVAYAAQLGIPAPTVENFQAMSAGMPLPPLSAAQTTGDVAGGCSYPTVQEASSLPELDSISDNYNTVCPPQFLAPSLGPCQVIKKDPLDGSGGRWFQTHQSQCLPTGGPQDEPTVPAGGGGDVGAGGDFGGGVIQNVPADQACTVMGVPFHQVQNNPDGTITIVDDTGASTTLDPNSPLIQCGPAGPAGGGGGVGGGGVLLPGPGGTLLPTPGGELTPRPGGGITTTPAGSGQCPPPTINVPPCPPAGGGNQIINIGPGGVTGTGTITTNPPGDGNRIVVTQTPPAVNVIVNVPTKPDKDLERSRVAGDQSKDALSFYDNWNSLGHCPYTTTILSNVDFGRFTLSGVLGWGFTPSGSAQAPGAFAPALSLLPFRLGETISGFIAGLIDSLQTTANDLIGNADCKPADVLPQLLSNMIIGFIDTFTSGALTPFRVPYTQQVNSSCPQRVPSTSECHTALLNGTINVDQWKCWVRANGTADVPAWQILQSQRTRPNVGEALQLWLRGEFGEAKLNKELMNRGVINDDEIDQYKKLTDYIPGPGDLVSMMLRDVFDPAVVEKYRLDEDFSAKFSDKLKGWAKAQGISEETMKLYWRFHWHMPSDGQLFEMLHRLRPGKEGVKNVTTQDDVKNALQINDLMPGWVDKLIEISYRPLGRIDVRRAYEVGVIDADDLPSYYQDLGYSEADAKTQAKYTVKASAAAVAKFQGLMTTPQLLQLYQKDGVSRDKAKELLIGNGLDDEGAENALSNADAQWAATIRVEKIKSIRSRYLKGEYSDAEATTDLQSAGVPFDRASQRVYAWSVEKDLEHKLPSTQQLCSLYSDGFIDSQTYFKRMQNLGWSDTDAYNFVNQCATKDLAKRAKELEAQLKKRQQQQRQLEADNEKRLKKIQQALKDAIPCVPPKKPTCPAAVPGSNGQSG